MWLIDFLLWRTVNTELIRKFAVYVNSPHEEFHFAFDFIDEVLTQRHASFLDLGELCHHSVSHVQDDILKEERFDLKEEDLFWDQLLHGGLVSPATHRSIFKLEDEDLLTVTYKHIDYWHELLLHLQRSNGGMICAIDRLRPSSLVLFSSIELSVLPESLCSHQIVDKRNLGGALHELKLTKRT